MKVVTRTSTGCRPSYRRAICTLCRYACVHQRLPCGSLHSSYTHHVSPVFFLLLRWKPHSARVRCTTPRQCPPTSNCVLSASRPRRRRRMRARSSCTRLPTRWNRSPWRSSRRGTETCRRTKLHRCCHRPHTKPRGVLVRAAAWGAAPVQWCRPRRRRTQVRSDDARAASTASATLQDTG